MADYKKNNGTKNIMSNVLDTYSGGSSTIPGEADFEAISGISTGNGIYITIKSSRLSGDLSTGTGRSDAFNAWMVANNFVMVYELAAPTTSQKDTYTETQICETGGYEEFNDAAYTAGNRDVQIPVGTETEYDRDIAPALAAFLTILPSADGQYLLDITSGVMSFAAYTPSEAASLSMSRPVLSENVLNDITEDPEEIPEDEFPDVDTEESR